MLKIFSLALTLFFSFVAQGQHKTFTAKLTVTYDMYLNFNHVQHFSSILHIGKNEAYFSYKPLLEKEIKSSATEHNISLIDTATSQVITTTDSIYSISFNLDKTKYLLKEKRPTLNWQLSNKTKKIANTLCYLASITYRGRSYKAWYAPSIPVKYGPYKFNGLPGLILKISDSDNEVIFIATEINYAQQQVSINIDPALQPVTLAQYLKIIKKQKQKFTNNLKRIQSRFPKGSQVTFDNIKFNSIERDFNVKASK